MNNKIIEENKEMLDKIAELTGKGIQNQCFIGSTNTCGFIYGSKENVLVALTLLIRQFLELPEANIEIEDIEECLKLATMSNEELSKVLEKKMSKLKDALENNEETISENKSLSDELDSDLKRLKELVEELEKIKKNM